MAAFECPRCHYQRSPRKLTLCNICSFLDDLVEEHHDGFHNDKLNVSCELCKPKHNEQMNTSESTAYMRRVMAPAIDRARAKAILNADRHGLAYFAKHGERGTRVMNVLRAEGHLMIEFHKDVPYIRVSAQSRHTALELLSSSQHTGDASSARQRRSERPKTTSPRGAVSHATCKHERTAKARAKCRAERTAS